MMSVTAMMWIFSLQHLVNLSVFTQSELNNLVRDLGLPKDCAETSVSRLQSKNSPQVHHFRGTRIVTKSSSHTLPTMILWFTAVIFLG
jgi:hypothetical protein